MIQEYVNALNLLNFVTIVLILIHLKPHFIYLLDIHQIYTF
jgi:hypothetical protein